jgi:ferric-dicitrate binding protein FerR (iron transport regulator)
MSEPDPQLQSELLALCDTLLDGELSAEQHARLESLVLSDAALRRLYVEYLQEHASLRLRSGQLGEVPLEAIRQPFAPTLPPPWWRSPGWLKAAAALLLATGAALWLRTPEPVPHVAILAEAKGTRWESSSQPTEPGSKIAPGRMRLAEGIAKLVFLSGAELTLEGPADLELIHPKLCRLHAGTLMAHVPPAGRGFTVKTAHAELIDHGTDFGIRAGEDGNASVRVLKGEVELRHQQGGNPLRLLDDETAAVSAQSLARLDSAGGELSLPTSKAGSGGERAFTHEITTATGQGAAAYVFSPGSIAHFSQELLLVKNLHNSAAYKRKALLRFDLTQLPNQSIEAARLTLHFAPTGFGFTSLGGDTEFAVYGVTSDAQDPWDPQTVKWNTAPAYSPDAGGVDESYATKLATFKLPRGVVHGAFSVEDPRLTHFLKTDANRQASLVVVSETVQKNGQGVVYGFAGNQHPTLSPPTLRLKLTP